jgi:predicted RNA binding protein YcfA (HicA-like mRNA interferase family)
MIDIIRRIAYNIIIKTEDIRDIMTAKELEKIAKENGFIEVRQRGSHKQFKNTNGKTVTIPMHKGDIPLGTANSILRVIGVKK